MTPTQDSAVPDAVAAALKEAERVAKRQKTCAARTTEALCNLIAAVEAAQQRLATDATADPGAVLRELSAQVDRMGAAAQMTADTKELHGAVAKLGKAVDRGFSLDVCAALRDVPMNGGALDQVVAEHLYHEGAFEVGDAFVAEAGVPGGAQLKEPYASMHAVLERLKQQDLAPALQWAAAHAAELRRGRGGAPSDLEFSLHRLAFLQALARGGPGAALAHARSSLVEFRTSHLPQLQRLMGAMCFAPRTAGGGSGGGPYAGLFSDSLWDDAARDFVRQSCALLGQAQDSPLLVATAAGSAALPTLLKLASVVSQAHQELAGPADQLPVEVPLGREFVFHSIFACPVSREQSTPDNPPMMLPCGHCMCRQSIAKIARAPNRAFKCPYCPVEAMVHQCVVLHFPEAQ